MSTRNYLSNPLRILEMNPPLYVDDFRYDLPENLIAQEPAAQRELSRLLVMDRRSGSIRHQVFRDIEQYLVPGDVLVLNDVRVVPARIRARRSTGGRIEIMILDGHSTGRERRILLKPAKRIAEGENLVLKDEATLKILKRKGKECVARIDGPFEWSDYLDRYGLMPLPPYIKRERENMDKARLDRERYQTVFAVNPGAVAAPTAGLHFSAELLDTLRAKGVTCVHMTLWVGWGTFKPVECRNVADHKMEEEMYTIPVETAREIRLAKAEKRRIVAVGTTTTRALESWVRIDPGFNPVPVTRTGLFITPGFEFRVVDALITNFHLPASTLIMLVSAFGGRRDILNAYRIAVQHGYRFYSYGDAMLIL
jgi:S-adenosylmethionine:tRNA ribosyltransferase-isomerase